MVIKKLTETYENIQLNEISEAMQGINEQR